jgi:4-hydroxyphenylpyruvate dioxygenase
MTVTQDNPLGLDGFVFVEFTSPDPAAMKALFEQMGFVPASTHPTKAVTRYKQGRINLLVNDEATGQVADFRAAHGPSANGMAFGVADVEQAYAEALKRGAVAADASATVLGEGARVLEGIGGSMLYLVDRQGADGGVYAGWDPGARRGGGRSRKQRRPRPARPSDPQRASVARCAPGRPSIATIFGFEEQKYFDIKGQATGLFSQAMIAPDQAPSASR